VGRLLGIRKSRVYALAAEGLLPTVRLGRRMWFPRRGLDALAEAAIKRAQERMAALQNTSVGSQLSMRLNMTGRPPRSLKPLLLLVARLLRCPT
jgi:excisionase family DNA binding protein